MIVGRKIKFLEIGQRVRTARRLYKKVEMIVTFFDGLDDHHAKFGEDRTTRAGCSCKNVVFVFTGRIPRSGKLPVLNLLTGQKSGLSPRRGDSLHRFTSNLAWPTVTWLNRRRGMGM